MALVRGTQFFIAALFLWGTPAVAAAEAPTYQAVTLPGFPVTAEVLLDEHGPLAYRIRIGDGRWRLPTGDAVLLDEEWWTPLRPLVEVPSPALSATTLDHIRERVAPAATRRLPDRLAALSFGDVTHAFFLRRAVPWTQAGPILIVEVGEAIFSYPRDWFASESEQRRILEAINRRLGRM